MQKQHECEVVSPRNAFAVKVLKLTAVAMGKFEMHLLAAWWHNKELSSTRSCGTGGSKEGNLLTRNTSTVVDDNRYRLRFMS